jgi:hypothetical protein
MNIGNSVIGAIVGGAIGDAAGHHYEGCASESSKEFFAKVQDQLHWATHGHTAAEVIHQRANASLPNIGVTNFPGNKLLKRDTEIAKNYLSEEELKLLNRIVTA